MYRTLNLLAAFIFTLGLISEATAQKDDAKPKDDADKPPAGWKEYSPKDKSFSVWIPEKPKSQIEKDRTETYGKQKVKINSLVFDTNNAIYIIEEAIVPAAGGAKIKDSMASGMRDGITNSINGKVTSESEIAVGSATGKEYRVESKVNVLRARVLSTETRVLMFRVSGKKEAIDGDEGKIFLESGRFMTKTASLGATPRILGSQFDREFKELAPDDGILIGFEIGLAKSGKRDLIKAAKPIYLVGDKEMPGEARGTKFDNVVTLKAKAGYAVGGISAKHGGNFDGMSISFMKIVEGKLDPKDSYESEYVGSDEKKTLTKIGGEGTIVVGIVGKSNDKDMTALGLLFKGQEKYEPKKK